MPVIRNAPKPCCAPNPQTRHVTKTSLTNVVIDVHWCLYARNLHPWEELLPKRGFLDFCTHLLCFRWWSRSQSCTHGNQWGSFSFMQLGRWGNICQAGERRAGSGQGVCAAGRTVECLDHAFPDLYSYLLIHAPHPPVLLHVLYCDSSPRAGEDPVGKDGSGILNIALTVFFPLSKSFRRLLTWNIFRLIAHPWHLLWPQWWTLKHWNIEIKKKSPVPNQVNSKGSQQSAMCPNILQGCF